MFADFTYETFAPRVGEAFQIQVSETEALQTSLIEVRPWVHDGDSRRQRVPFALVFQGPPGHAFPQRIYPVRNDGLGEFEIFLVPLQPNAAGTLYEAVFG